MQDIDVVIPCLEIRGGRAADESGLPGLADPRDPVEITRHYRRQGAGTVFADFLDPWDRYPAIAPLITRLAEAASRLWVSIDGGRLPDLEAAAAVFERGAVVIGAGDAALKRPAVVRQVTARYGADRVVGLCNVRRTGPRSWTVSARDGEVDTGLDAVAWSRELVRLGAGMVLPNSLDGEREGRGYDLALNDLVGTATGVPVIASGGGASVEHLAEALGRRAVRAAVVYRAAHSGHLPLADALGVLRRRHLA